MTIINYMVKKMAYLMNELIRLRWHFKKLSTMDCTVSKVKKTVRHFYLFQTNNQISANFIFYSYRLILIISLTFNRKIKNFECTQEIVSQKLYKTEQYCLLNKIMQ